MSDLVCYLLAGITLLILGLYAGYLLKSILMVLNQLWKIMWEAHHRQPVTPLTFSQRILMIVSTVILGPGLTGIGVACWVESVTDWQTYQTLAKHGEKYTVQLTGFETHLSSRGGTTHQIKFDFNGVEHHASVSPQRYRALIDAGHLYITDERQTVDVMVIGNQWRLAGTTFNADGDTAFLLISPILTGLGLHFNRATFNGLLGQVNKTSDNGI